MGCWNGTCGVTRLPIFHGNPVVGFLLTQSPERSGENVASGFCYSHGLWAPRATHFFSTYDDYGSFEGVEVPDWARTIIERNLRANVLPMEEDKYRAKAIVPADVNLDEELFRQIREDRVKVNHFPYVKTKIDSDPNDLDDDRYAFIQSKTPVPIKIGFMMVHRFAFDYMLGLTLGWRDVTRQGMIEEAKKSISKQQEKTNERMKEVNKADLTDELRSDLEGLFYTGMVRDEFEVSGILPRFEHNRSIGDEYLTAILKAAKNDDTDRLDAILGYMADFAMFSAGMMAMRVSWAPQAGAGSQDGDLNLYKGLNAAVEGWIKARDEEWGEDEDEE